MAALSSPPCFLALFAYSSRTLGEVDREEGAAAAPADFNVVDPVDLHVPDVAEDAVHGDVVALPGDLGLHRKEGPDPGADEAEGPPRVGPVKAFRVGRPDARVGVVEARRARVRVLHAEEDGEERGHVAEGEAEHDEPVHIRVRLDEVDRHVLAVDAGSNLDHGDKKGGRRGDGAGVSTKI